MLPLITYTYTLHTFAKEQIGALFCAKLYRCFHKTSHSVHEEEARLCQNGHRPTTDATSKSPVPFVIDLATDFRAFLVTGQYEEDHRAKNDTAFSINFVRVMFSSYNFSYGHPTPLHKLQVTFLFC